MTLSVLGCVVACKKSGDDCRQEKRGSASILNAPDSLRKNEIYSLTIEFLVENSCGELHSIDANLEDKTLEASLIIEYNSCACEDIYETRTTDYPISFADTGHYQLSIWAAENEYDIYNLTVYE